MAYWLEDLQANGWITVPLVGEQENAAEIIQGIAQSLGRSVLKDVDTLVPKTQEQARRNSTSAYCGLDVFPCHTDFAHWPTPPRYIALWSAHESETPTQVVPWSSVRLPQNIEETWCRATWRVTRVHRPFVCTMHLDRANVQAIRWDQYAMEPNDEIARLVKPEIKDLLELARKRDSIQIKWRGDRRVLVLDNWRVMHARPAVSGSDLNRKLNRVIFGGENEQQPAVSLGV